MKEKASDIKFVSLYSTIKVMHGPINIRFVNALMLKRHCSVCIKFWPVYCKTDSREIVFNLP